MRKYAMTEEDSTKGVCWQYALACILGVNPEKVPVFVSETKHSSDYVEKTRQWLKRKYKKSIVFISANEFMETRKPRYNPIPGPEGYSIMVVSTEDDDTNHVMIAKNGVFYYDSTGIENDALRTVIGYFVIYNL